MKHSLVKKLITVAIGLTGTYARYDRIIALKVYTESNFYKLIIQRCCRNFIHI